LRKKQRFKSCISLPGAGAQYASFRMEKRSLLSRVCALLPIADSGIYRQKFFLLFQACAVCRAAATAHAFGRRLNKLALSW
jgi:hypothetical protein